MDFDKIKRAAKDTIKMVSNKVEKKLSSFDEDEEDIVELKHESKYDDVDDFSVEEDFLGTTQRFDMKDALNRFRKRQDKIEDTLSDLIKNNDTKQAEETNVNEFIENNFTDLKRDINESISDIDTDISNLSTQYSGHLTKLDNDIKTLNERMVNIVSLTEKTDNALGTLSENLESAIIDINKKLSDITSTISGVNRINDSIFDLKNSQMNTRNFLGDLEASFNSLKKKMVAGVTILSIISAIIAVLEVINLLS